MYLLALPEDGILMYHYNDQSMLSLDDPSDRVNLKTLHWMVLDSGNICHPVGILKNADITPREPTICSLIQQGVNIGFNRSRGIKCCTHSACGICAR